MVDPITFVLHAGMIIANSLIVKYLFDLEKDNCECAIMDYRRKYIIGYSLYAIIAAGLGILGLGKYIKRTFIGSNTVVLSLFSATVLVASILNVVFVFQYVDSLKKMSCQCSESQYKTLMQVIAGFQAAGIGFIIFGLAYVVFMIGTMSSFQKTLMKA